MAKGFITDNFMLHSSYAAELYQHCEDLPILDYHNHLSAKEIYEDFCYNTITEAWLNGDHYKWRQMRACGFEESLVSGGGDDYERFLSYAKTMGKIMGNPLYHWSHLELKRYFGVDLVLNVENAPEIYKRCNELIKTKEYSVRNLLAMRKVELLCTTDDPIDSLEYHKLVAESESRFKVLPTWRPDKVMAIEQSFFSDYIATLSSLTSIEIVSLESLKAALQMRMDHFKANGCIIADHGLTKFYASDYTTEEIDAIINKVICQKEQPTPEEAEKYKTALLFELLKMNHENGIVQQLHQGAIRNQNSKLFNTLGPDVGCDSLDDHSIAYELGRVLDKQNCNDTLARTVIYNLNPKDSEVMASMVYNFNDGVTPGKMQYGAAWWFLDTHKGMVAQLEVLSSYGAIGQFIGMLTDSRSYLSFTRHEYFRRILCNFLGAQVESGLLPESEMETIKECVANISYYNVKNYLNL